MMKTVESISVAINQIDEKKENLKKAFDDLQIHRSLLSRSFNLSWSEIDSHFSSLQSSLCNRFQILQSAANSPDFDRTEASTAEATLLWPELRKFCEKMDGKGLGKYIIENSKKRASINLELPAAIRCSANPAALVLDAIEDSYHCSSSPSSSFRAIDGRRVFVLLLEALIKINANITNDLRERAKTLAIDWKPKIGNKPSEALGFLHLIAVFELVSIFKTSELADYVFLISKCKQVTTICKKIGFEKHRISDLINKLLNTGRLLVSIRFIYEFGMTDEFPPVHILKTSLKNSREAAKRVCAEGNNSLQAQNEATDKELNALRAVIHIVKEKNLESEFVEEKLEECIDQLAKEKAKRKRVHNPYIAKPMQPQHQFDNNRPQAIPFPSQQPPLLPNPSHCSNPYGFVSSTMPGVAVPYSHGSVLVQGVASQTVYYEQQRGYGGYALQPQFQPPYYHQ